MLRRLLRYGRVLVPTLLFGGFFLYAAVTGAQPTIYAVAFVVVAQFLWLAIPRLARRLGEMVANYRASG